MLKNYSIRKKERKNSDITLPLQIAVPTCRHISAASAFSSRVLPLVRQLGDRWRRRPTPGAQAFMYLPRP
jgi:hypothetical protein